MLVPTVALKVPLASGHWPPALEMTRCPVLGEFGSRHRKFSGVWMYPVAMTVGPTDTMAMPWYPLPPLASAPPPPPPP